MDYYSGYKHLLGHAYDDGDWDCYGLCRRYYKDVYELEAPNYGRSADFFQEGVDLISDFLLEEGFSVVDVAWDKLRPGDGLMMSIRSRETPGDGVNHLAVFVGNGTFIHHQYGKESREDYMDSKWAKRIVAVVRHPLITQRNAERETKNPVDVLTLIPDHVKRKYGIVPPTVLGTDSRESGGSST